MQTYDTTPKRRLFELLVSQGMQANQDVTFITDGGDDVRDTCRSTSTPTPSTCSTGST